MAWAKKKTKGGRKPIPAGSAGETTKAGVGAAKGQLKSSGACGARGVRNGGNMSIQDPEGETINLRKVDRHPVIKQVERRVRTWDTGPGQRKGEQGKNAHLVEKVHWHKYCLNPSGEHTK